MPFSYLKAELKSRGRLVKDLVEWDGRSWNFGDVGELLVELAQRTNPPAPVRHQVGGPAHDRLELALPAITVIADYFYRVCGGRFLMPAKLMNISVQLTLDGDPFQIFRLARYLAHHLERRFRRAPSTWVSQEAADAFGTSVENSAANWQNLQCSFQEFVAANN